MMAFVTRRQAIALTGAVPLANFEHQIPASVIARHDEAVENCLGRQISDRSSRGFGNMPVPGPDGIDIGIYAARTAATLLEIYTAAFLQPQSRYYKDARLVERMRWTSSYLNRAQHETGFIDYLDTNFDSAPDTAFTVWSAATATCLARRAGEKELVAFVEPFLTKAGAGLARGGVHTPNHRWVISSALAQIDEVFPHPAYRRRIDQWLAEGIDIDADGQFSERSTAVYNPICDRCFVVLAAKLRRDDLLNPVRKNLDSMLYLLHANGDVVTEISRRQDRGSRANMQPYWFPLHYLAVKDRNGQWANLAGRYASAASLSALMEYPEMAVPLPPLVPLPHRFTRPMESLGIVRFRQGDSSSTFLSGDSAFFTSQHGNARLASIRLASAFFGKGQFSGPRITESNGAFRLEQRLEAGYYQPFIPPQRVTSDDWDTTRERRERTDVSQLRQSVALRQTESGFRLSIVVEGTKDVPIALEVNFGDTGELKGCEPAGEDRYLLPNGYGSFSTSGSTLRFGPGLCRHRWTKIRGAAPKPPGRTVCLTGFSPLSYELELTWT